MIGTFPSIVSVGELADRRRATIDDVLRAAALLGIVPVLTIDGLPYFAEGDVAELAAHVDPQRRGRRHLPIDKPLETSRP